MGYYIAIGNAVPEFSKEDGELYSGWNVEKISNENAPTFIGDEVTGNRNIRMPSYTGWGEFCDKVGLSELFYAQYSGLFRQHPGCVMINQEIYQKVANALEEYQKHAKRPPGYDDFGNYDYDLARLMWLEYWMKWALENCETPAIYNS
jgi:hypothetical protein